MQMEAECNRPRLRLRASLELILSRLYIMLSYVPIICLVTLVPQQPTAGHELYYTAEHTFAVLLIVENLFGQSLCGIPPNLKVGT